MEEIYSSVSSSHNGVAYSTIIIFGAFVFLVLTARLYYSGRVTDVLRKASFFSMMLLFVQAVLGLMMAFYSPDYQSLNGTDAYFNHFKYALGILMSGGIIAFVNSNLKKKDVVSTGIMALVFLAALIFEYVFPWGKLLGL